MTSDTTPSGSAGDGRERAATADPAARRNGPGDERGTARAGGRLGKFSRRRLAYWTAGGVAALLLLVVALRPTPMPVETGEVVRGPMETTVEVDGVTRVRDRFSVTAPVSGRLERVSVREGDFVEAGQVLARISRAPLDPNARAEAQARLASARSALREAEERVGQTAAVMEQTALRAQRIARVGEEGGASRETVELAALEAANARREHVAARSRVDGVRGEVEAATIALTGEAGAPVEVRAPVAGRVLGVDDPSERVLAAGTPLVELGETGRLEVVAEVLSADAVRIESGAPMRIGGWGGDELRARVRLVEPGAFTRVSALGVEEQRVRVVGDLAEAPPALGDGYRVEARIVTWAAADAVKVPASALFRDGAGWAAFVMADGRAERRTVEVGERNPREAEVLAGVGEGETVILYPSDELDDGARVRAR